MITIQAGNYSNFVGSHIFNLQNPETQNEGDECKPTSFWREVKRGSVRGYSPRLLMFDSKQNASCLQHTSASSKSDADSDASLWDGKIDMIVDEDPEVENVSKRAKRLLSSDELHWGDIINWKVSPREMHLLPNFSHNPQTGQLSNYSQGLEVWKIMEETTEDGIRKYSEEIDNLEGFHMLVDQCEGYSGFASGILQHISDEYEKKMCIGFGISPPEITSKSEGDQGKKGRTFKTRINNTALLWNAFNSHSSVFSSVGLTSDVCVPQSVPVQLPHLSFESTSAYQSSSILAVALDTLMIPCVTTNPSLSFSELASFLSALGRKMTMVSSSFPFPHNFRRTSLFEALSKSDLDSSIHSLTPGANVDFKSSTGNYFAIRGVPVSATISETERKGLVSWQRELKDPGSCLEIYARESFPRSVNLVKGILKPVIITDPFPVTVVDEHARNTFNVATGYSNGIVNKWGLSCLSTAQNTPIVGGILDKLLVEVTGRKTDGNAVTQTLAPFNELGMESDDFLEAVNNLETLRDTYRTSS